MSGTFRRRQDYERHGKGRVFGFDAGSVGVVLILQLCRRCAVVVGEIFLDVGECSFQSRVAYDREVGRWRCRRGSGCCGGSLVAEDVFYTREKLVEVVGCVAVSLDGLLPLVAYFVVATAHRALPDMRFKLTRECFAFHFLLDLGFQ